MTPISVRRTLTCTYQPLQ